MIYAPRAALFGLAGAAIAIAALSLASGAASLTPAEVAAAIWAGPGGEGSGAGVIWWIRAPRVVSAALVGAGLAAAGAALQGMFRNPLADPGLIGVSSGAALGVVAALLGLIPFGAALPTWGYPGAAFVGGLAATWLVTRLSRRGERVDPASMILAGVAINAIAGALIGTAIYAADDAELRTITLWTLGSLGGTDWTSASIIALISAPCLWALSRAGAGLDLLSLGAREAQHLGVRVDRLRAHVIASSALIVGAGVGFTGLIGFVGLIVPHLIRIAIGPSHRVLIPASALGGAALLGAADLGARTIAAPAELPIGVLTALVGGPFFLGLLARQKRTGLR